MIDKDVIEGKIKQGEGKVQDAIGDATGSTEDQGAGKAKQVTGKIQEEYGKAKDAVHDALDKDQV
jgi:uncharacterized protein YjbJ (UPF0337 family)